MTDPRDPVRLSQGDDTVADVVRASRTDVPDAARMERMLHGLRARIDTPNDGGDGDGGNDGGSSNSAGSGAAARAVTTSATRAATKVVGVLAAGGAIVAYVASGSQPRPEPAPTAPTSSTPVARAREPATAAAAPLSSEAPTIAIDSLPDTRPSAKSVTLTPAATNSAPSGAGPSEMLLLSDAQRALASDPARALELTTRHEKEFPRGAFAEERDVLRIDALVRLGRKDEAERQAKRHFAAHPASAHRARIDGLLR